MLARRTLIRGGAFTFPTLTPDGSPVTIIDDGKHNAFPGIAWLDATHCLLTYRRGTDHHTDGEIYGRIGTVTGTSVSWGTAFLIHTDADDVRCEDNVSIIDNQIVLTGRLWDGTANHDPFILICDDAPASFTSSSTWGSPISVPLTDGTAQNTIIGRVQKLQNSTYIVGFTIYSSSSTTSANGVLISTDLDDWSARTKVTIGALGSNPMYTEIDVEEMPNGGLIAHLRTEHSPTFHYISSSTDHGATWTAPTSLYSAWGLPMFRRLASGLELAVHRTATADYHTYWRQSQGGIWSAETLLDHALVNGLASSGVYATLLEFDSTHVLCVYASERADATGSEANIYSQVFTVS